MKETPRLEETTGTARVVRGSSAGVTLASVSKVWVRVSQRFKTYAKSAIHLLSPAGWLAVLTVAIGLTLGLYLHLVELLAAGIVALVILVATIPYLLGLKAYEVSLELSRDRILKGQVALGFLKVKNSGRRLMLPGTIDVPVAEGLLEVQIPSLRAGASHQEPLQIPGLRRGALQIGPASVVRSDPLSLIKRERDWPGKHTLFVYPETTRLPSVSTGFLRDLEGKASRTIVSDDLSFHAIREYQHGDARRNVHWKSTAKTGTLMVRQYEKTMRSQMVITLAANTLEYRGDDEFELAVSAAGSLGLRALTDGRELYMFMPKLASLREFNTRSSRNLLDELTLIYHSEKMQSIAEVTGLAAERASAASLAFIVCGSGLTAQMLQKATQPLSREMATVAVIADIHAEPGIWMLGDLTVLRIGLIDDLRHLLLRGVGGTNE